MFDLHDPKNVSHVRKLFYKRFAWKVEKMGLDPEDVLQDVYTTILHRNDPASGCTPYDPARGCVSNYLFKVIVSIVYHARRVKYRTKRGAALASALPLHLEGDGGEIFDPDWLPCQDPGEGGDPWGRAAEEAGIPLEVLRECADGRDLVAEARAERRRAAEEALAAKIDLRRATAEARAAREALAALSPKERAERDRAHKKAYQAAYFQRKKEEAAAARKGKAPSQG